MKVALLLAAGTFALYCAAFALVACLFQEKPALAVSRPWFPRDATMPAAERDLRDAIVHCNGPWNGLSNIEREPCRLRCFASDRTALWSRLLSESVCERLR